MKKLSLVLCIMIIISCAGCGSSDSTIMSDTQSGAELEITEEITSETVITEAATETAASEDTASESNSKYNAFINEYTSFEVTSTNLNNGVWDDIISNTDKGSNKSPQLEWDAVDGAALYVIIMDDTGMDFIHWKSDNVTETKLDEGWAQSSDYIGPFPPSGSTHTYEIYVAALKAPVEGVNEAFCLGRNLKFEENFKALDIDAERNNGNIIAVGRISGTFSN